MKKPLSDIRISSMISHLPFKPLLKLLSPLLDRILGIRELRKAYEQERLSGLDKQIFSKKLLEFLNTTIEGGDDVINKVPQKGPFIIVCNHPHGFIEGVALLRLLYNHRADTKALSNVALDVFKEIQDYFILVHNLKPNSPKNIQSLRKCFTHIKDGGLLMMFPASRVSTYSYKKKQVIDYQWNPLPIKISEQLDVPVLPVFISGKNSKLFYFLGRIHPFFRTILSPKEMLRLKNYTLKLQAGNVISPLLLKKFKSTEEKTIFTRIQCYLRDPEYFKPWSKDNPPETFEDIIPPSDQATIKEELANLPKQQHLLDENTFSVYYGYAEQIPTCVREITRLREITFRELNEGSGLSCDTDKFDTTYVHLLVFNHATEEIIGAYRMGQTDILLKDGDVSNLYLSQIFDFEPSFINRAEPSLEFGRSFIIKPYQKQYLSLHLLWKGIGEFICRNPQYKNLYGTVSLSKLYDPRSVSIINQILVKNSPGVKPKNSFKSILSPEVTELLSTQNWSLSQISALIMGVEQDQKDLPILLKNYYKLDAEFHCISIDTNFNNTPGLLLSVNMRNIPENKLNVYLNKCKENT